MLIRLHDSKKNTIGHLLNFSHVSIIKHIQSNKSFLSTITTIFVIARDFSHNLQSFNKRSQYVKFRKYCEITQCAEKGFNPQYF